MSLQYNNRLFLTQWNLPNPSGANTSSTALGYSYDYNKYQEGHTGRVEFADSLYDATLDRAWTYDHAGRLLLAYTGTEANSDWESAPTGPYARGYNYDQFGNLTSRYGWGGATRDGNSNYSTTFTTKNQRAGHTYDLAGNVTNDGGQSFTYDATGQQAWASSGNLAQFYDGDGLRLKKVENGATTYYLRSTVLGQQVTAELNASGQWTRGYVYLGGTLLAIQDVPQNRVLWTHQEPFAKSQRITDSSGAIVAGVELEPFGLETNRSFDWSSVNQKRQFTTYDRDANGSDEAMFRRYNRWHDRFDQPDPYDGSYDAGDPQSLNRYAYTQGDPVNFVDPTGLQDDLCLDGNGNLVPCDQVPPGHDPIERVSVRISPLADYLFVLNSRFRGFFGQGRAGNPLPRIPQAARDAGRDALTAVTCGNNPVTNEPVFTREPRGATGRLRLGQRPTGEGHFRARRDSGIPHRGLDISAPVGTPVYANRAGTVTLSTTGDSGNNVRINHGNQVTTNYAHLQSFAPGIANGTQVAQGQLIGYAGQTGNARNQPAAEAHLHFGVTVNGSNVNPANYLNSPCPNANNNSV
jgi:RHS repeat-associated protein